MAHQSGTLKKALRCTKCKFPLAGRWMDTLMAVRAATFSEGLHYTEIWCDREGKTAVLQLNWVKIHCALELKYAIKVVARGFFFFFNKIKAAQAAKQKKKIHRTEKEQSLWVMIRKVSQALHHKLGPVYFPNTVCFILRLLPLHKRNCCQALIAQICMLKIDNT